MDFLKYVKYYQNFEVNYQIIYHEMDVFCKAFLGYTWDNCDQARQKGTPQGTGLEISLFFFIPTVCGI